MIITADMDIADDLRPYYPDGTMAKGVTLVDTETGYHERIMMNAKGVPLLDDEWEYACVQVYYPPVVLKNQAGRVIMTERDLWPVF